MRKISLLLFAAIMLAAIGCNNNPTPEQIRTTQTLNRMALQLDDLDQARRQGERDKLWKQIGMPEMASDGEYGFKK